MDSPLDPKRHPFRPDLAAKKLEGLVKAERFVAPTAYQVSAGVASVRKSPAPDAEQLSQALHGDVVEIYEEQAGFGWGQMQSDGYVGWFDMAALSMPVLPVHAKVKALRTYAFSDPFVKAAPHFLLSLNATLSLTEERSNGFVRCERAGWVFEKHLSALDVFEPDPIDIASRFIGAPYQWGGVESLGLDCSGLIQTSWKAAGVRLPRDSYMMVDVGEEVTTDERLSGLKRGDLLLWNGHVVAMADASRIIHATAYHMEVVVEDALPAIARITRKYGPMLSVRRIG